MIRSMDELTMEATYLKGDISRMVCENPSPEDMCRALERLSTLLSDMVEAMAEEE